MERGVIKTARPKRSTNISSTRFLTIDSTKNQLKEFSSGAGVTSITKPDFYEEGRTIVEIEHNLGYQPFVHAWFRVVGQEDWRKMLGFTVVDLGDGSSIYLSGAIGRPNNDILQLCFWTEFFGPEVTLDIEYGYTIYLDPYRDAWST